MTTYEPGQTIPWERLSDESGQAYESFLIYRDLGINRSLDRVGELLAAARDTGAPKEPGNKAGHKRASGCLRKRSVRYRWSERVRAYDDFLFREKDRIRTAELQRQFAADLEAAPARRMGRGR